jgi:hypothetical protein
LPFTASNSSDRSTLGPGENSIRRLWRVFSKKVGNHAHHIAPHYMFYNFCRIHLTLRVTPAMEGDISDHVWNIEEILTLTEKK